MHFKQVGDILPVQWKGRTHEQNSCSWAFSRLYTLPLHRICGLPLPCCRAMSVKDVHCHEYCSTS